MSTTQEVAAKLDEFHALIAEERKANDERIAALEKTGTEVPEHTAKIKKIEAAIDETRAEIESLTKAMDRAAVGGKGQEKDEDVAKAALIFFNSQRREKDPIKRDVSADEVDAYRRYSDAFSKYVTHGGDGFGSALPESVRAEMSSGGDADGGFLVPTEMSSRVQRRLFETSEVRQYATVMSITTDRVELPTDTNSGTSGGWVGEKEARTETATPQIGRQVIDVHEQYAEPHATQRLLDDAAVDVAGWLGEKIADILTRTENTAFVSGNGVTKPRGFMDYSSAAVTTDDASRSWGVLQYVVTGASGGLAEISGIAGTADVDPLLTVISKLKPNYRGGAAWYMNRATEALFRKAKDGDGRYLVGMGDIRDSAVGFDLFGFPIRTFEDMDDVAANSFSVAFGDLATAYTIVDRQGIRVLRDPYTSKPFVKFYTTKRVGGDVTNFDALKLLKFGTS